MTAITAILEPQWSNLRMKTRQLIIGLAAAAITLSGAALGDEIYKWTDADGNIHYEDRPSGGPNDERLLISSSRTNNSAVQQRSQARRASQASLQNTRDARSADAAAAARQQAAIAEQEKLCMNYRAKLETLVQSRRLYREDENGERVYLDATQKLEARENAQQLIEENC